MELQKKPVEITESKLLLAEGKDEENFFKALLRKLEINGVQIISVGGNANFEKEYLPFIKLSGFANVNTIGFVRDAEEKPAESAFDSICGIIKKCSPQLPVPYKMQTVINKNGYKIGIFIMPDCKSKVMLEDLCIDSVKNSDLFKYADEYVSKAQSIFEKEKSEKKFNKSKSQIQTFLAGKVPIVNNLGIAAQNYVWDFDNAAFDDIKKFIRELFCYN